MIEILTAAQLTRARRTGALVGSILQNLRDRTRVGTNLLEIDEWTRELIEDAGAESCYVDYAPSFGGDGPFGHYICTSVNDAVLHGMPRDYALADGDLLSLDFAIKLDGIASDSAISFLVGDSRPEESVALIDATQRALTAGIAAAGPGKKLGGHLPCDRDRARRRRLPDQHRLRWARHRVEHAPGSARAQYRARRAGVQAAPGPAAGPGALGDGRYRAAGHRSDRWVDAAQRHRLSYRAQ